MPGSESPEAATSAALTARDLVAGYVPGINILNGMSVDVLPGQVRCVLGPNGTGKSTLLKVIFGFLPALSGSVTANGRALRGTPPHRMGAAGITYLPQRPSVFPFLSVEVNLRLGTWPFRRNRALAGPRT
jgi:branched-chain amino acid transport system ATP-binding protein